MTLPTHLLAGLIIGKLTGNYTAAIAGSLLIDLDHIVSFYRHGILFKLKKLIKEISDEKDPWKDQRNYLHNIFVWAAISVILCLINFNFGIIFSICYAVHFVFDALNTVNFYPFYPSKKFPVKGFIKYGTRRELIFDLFLIIVLVLVFLIQGKNI